MSFIGNLIRQATTEPKPAALNVNATRLGAVAEHMRAVIPLPMSAAECRAAILRGEVKLCGVPLRVIGS